MTLLTMLACGLFQPGISPTPLPPSPISSFCATSSVENLTLRTGPGTLFRARAALRKDIQFLVLGQSPGDQWVSVKTLDGRLGCVFSLLLNAATAIAAAPIIQPENVQWVKGRVLDLSGNPVSGIQFSFVRGSGSNPPRNDSITDATGTFYAFMPTSARGTGTVGYTAVACTSNTMDANCNCLNAICGKPDPELTNITLPFSGTLTFIWK
jgi:hypothetical protein